jgi:hypothetical protein
MPKIFYVGGGTHSRGVLRAVIPLAQLESFVPPQSATYLGPTFPERSESSASSTIVEISHDERTGAWSLGFFQLSASPTDFDQRLRYLPEPGDTRIVARTTKRTGEAGFFHGLMTGLRFGPGSCD